MIYLAADHRGFELKKAVEELLTSQEQPFEDMGASSLKPDDDYVDFARKACEKIAEDPALHKGILICGSGHGMDMVANKYKGLRAAMGFNRYVAVQSREHEDANVLVLPADWLKPQEAKDIVFEFLGSHFAGEERHMRRLRKIEEVEEKNLNTGPKRSSDFGVTFELPR